MDWKSDYQLGHAPMDDTHRDYVALVTCLDQAERDKVLAAMDALIEHSMEHFAQENRWMEECGFPPIHCHEGEHERVLSSLQQMRTNVATDPGIGKILAKELEAWFAQHAATMDNALAFYMRQVNYTPTAGSGRQ